jgi:hypothetical protein
MGMIGHVFIALKLNLFSQRFSEAGFERASGP